MRPIPLNIFLPPQSLLNVEQPDYAKLPSLQRLVVGEIIYPPSFASQVCRTTQNAPRGIATGRLREICQRFPGPARSALGFGWV